MAANTIYITAGLPVAKDGETPSAGVNTVYITAGLPPEPAEAAEEESSIPVIMHHRRLMQGAA